ncbi:MAG: MATE family efflux transporter, partial [Turicibacter sp.]|nr:MATE family efflux transporter [Turicibacter sp.]
LFIYTFKMGVLGVGLATLIANIFMTLSFHRKSKALFNIDSKNKYRLTTYFELIKLGLPMSSQRVLFTLVNILLAKMITSFGTEAIAAQKIGLQIESITYMVIGGLNGAIASFVGQNYGAQKRNRITEGVKVSMGIGIIYALVTTFILLVIPESLARCFVSDLTTIQITTDYLRIVGLTQVFMAIEIICNGAFVGLGMPKIPETISIIFTTLRIPMAWLFIQWFGVNGIWISISVSMLLKGVTAIFVYWRKGKEGIMNVDTAKKSSR